MIKVSVLGMLLPRLVNTVTVGDGWNSSFGWVSLDTARHSNKPVMLIVTSPTCPRCRELKIKFVSHEGIRKLSVYFSMVHVRPEDLPPAGDPDNIFRPDGGYVPRILFFDSNFNFLPEIQGPVSSHQYYYGEPDNVHISMINALNLIRWRESRP